MLNPAHKRSISSINGTPITKQSIKVVRNSQKNSNSNFEPIANSISNTMKSLTPTKNSVIDSEKTGIKTKSMNDASHDVVKAKSNNKKPVNENHIVTKLPEKFDRPSLINNITNMPTTTLKHIQKSLMKKTTIANPKMMEEEYTPVEVKTNNASKETASKISTSDKIRLAGREENTDKQLKKSIMDNSYSFDKSFTSNTSEINKIRVSKRESKSPTQLSSNSNNSFKTSKSPHAMKPILKTSAKTPVQKNSLLKKYEDLKNNRRPSPVYEKLNSTSKPTSNSTSPSSTTRTTKSVFVAKEASSTLSTALKKSQASFRDTNTSPLLRVNININI